MSDAILGFLSQPLWVFMAVLARISPALMLMPPLRSSSVPMRVRALFAIAVAAIIAPLAFARAEPMPSDVIHIGLAMTCEVLLGMLLGSIIVLAIASLQIAGQAVGHLAGFDVAASVDPSSDEQMPVVANLLGLISMAVLLILGGHRELIQCCLESFQRYPAGGVYFETAWLTEYEQVLRHTFVVGIRAAAPLATALLITNVLTGLLARTLPQLNVLAIGFNINAMALLVLLFVSVGGVTWVFQQELSVWIDSCHRVVAIDP
jgi:flagellar biosynthesis protein FliR